MVPVRITVFSSAIVIDVIGGGAESSHCYVRFGPRREPSRSAHSQLLLLFFLRPPTVAIGA